VAVAVASGAAFGAEKPTVTGELKKWHNVTITFDGPETSEDAAPNPFTDYRLTVTFSQGLRRIAVQGYYAADGRAGFTGGDKGGKWRVHFVPDSAGRWSYAASFRTGAGVATAPGAGAGKPAAFDGASGELDIGPTDKKGRDFRGKGLLRYVGKHYLRFAGSAEYFIKGGADSPENLLGYADFDGTFDTGKGKRRGEAAGGRLHKYAPHVKDWRPGDPQWRGGKGRGLIGAMNYLASVGMNSVYFIPYNIDGGDGKDTWPWTSPKERFRFDCSKLDQWEIVFSHMDRLGLMLHVITQETENDQGLDGGALGPQRKLYYRELIARFAHHLAITWNLGEENTNTDAQRKAFAAWIHRLDPYDHPVVVHTFPGRYDKVYTPLLGFEDFEGPSLQMGNMRGTHAETIKWVVRSANSGRRWFVSLDEIGPAHTGVKPDKDDPGHDGVRRHALWGNLMAGGAGCEWYFGYKYAHNDLNCEDWRSRSKMWDQTRHAIEFFQRHLPFWAMRHGDNLTSAGDDYCFYAEGKVYAIYLPAGGPTTLKLPKGKFVVKWYNPRTGGGLLDGSVASVTGPGSPSIGEPPAEKGRDWVALVKLPGELMVSPDADPPPFGAGEVPPPRAAAPARTGKPPAVKSLALVNADTDKVIKGYEALEDGATLDLAKLPTRNLSVIARTGGDVTAVRFSVDGKAGRNERTAPYVLAGDTAGDFNAWTPSIGTHKITAVADGPGGARSKPLTITINVTEGSR